MHTNPASSTDPSVEVDLAVSPDTVGRTTRSRPRGLGVVAAAALVALSGLGAVAAAATADGSSATHQRTSTSPVSVSLPGARELAPQPGDANVGPVPAPDAQPHPAPQPDPEPPATPGDLELNTNNVDLPDNVYEGSFDVRNDGGSPIEWNWLMGNYGIAVSQASGTLAPGESVTVFFTINPFQLPEGDFLFANSVYTDDQAKDLHITGHRPAFVVNPDHPKPGLDFAAS